MSVTNPDSDDSEGYKSPKAVVKKLFPRIVEHIEYRLPLIEYNTCPCCGGKGFVRVISDKEK